MRKSQGIPPWFTTPYRRKAIWANLNWYAWQIILGVKNWFVYSRVIWHQRSFDYESTLYFLEFHFQRMADFHRKDGVTMERKETAAQLEMCADLCRRLVDDYSLNSQERDNDLKLLTSIINRRLFTWWD